jgi:hypothetical protein
MRRTLLTIAAAPETGFRRFGTAVNAVVTVQGLLGDGRGDDGNFANDGIDVLVFEV